MKKLIKIIPTVITIVVISIFIFYVQQNWDRILQLADISGWTLALLCVLVLITISQNGLVNYLLYQSMNVKINYFLSFGLAIVNTLANQLPLSGGLIAKGLYLSKKYKLPISKYLSATGALFICFLSTNGVIGLIALWYLNSYQGKYIPYYLILGFGLMTLSIIVLFFPIKNIRIPEKYHKYVADFASGWKVLIIRKWLLIKLISIQLLSILTIALRYKIALKAFSQDVTIIESLLIASATILTRLVSIAPGGLGVREGLAASIAVILGFDPVISIVAVGLDRLISTILIIFLGIYFLSIFGRSVVFEEKNPDNMPRN